MNQDSYVLNWNSDLQSEPLSIIEVLKALPSKFLESVEREERMMRDPNYEYTRIHIASREIAEMMLNPETPIEIRRGLEWATFAGYQWVKKEDLP